MTDEVKIERLKKLGIAFGAVLCLLIGYGFGARGSSGEKAAESTQQQETKKTVVEEALTQDYVEDFLIAYYTKKDLEENRNRYKVYMTDSMYQRELSLEAAPVQQTYKGFVVDFKFKKAEIYIDEANKTVLAKVSYTNTLLAEKNSYEKAQKDVANQATLRLTYSTVNGKLLVNRIENILLTTNSTPDNDYPDYGTSHTETTEGGE
ncbi:hypothetical protein ACS6ZZ_03155 [Streptococcus suis]|uniref:hypothetical protein n=1 Tax=Streptococcus suis TaxID=1307 RepID=UPI000CF44F0D|nr:hypothetical protein [Streptococcus suis]